MASRPGVSHLLLVFAVLTLLAACVPAPTAPAPAAGQPAEQATTAPAASTGVKTLTIAQTADPGTGDPQLTTEEYFLALNVYDRLVEAVTTSPGISELQPGLAEKWEVTPDGLVYTFHLRQGVKFHSGDILTADDVIFTFDRMLNPATKALNTDFLDMIAGAQERMDGAATETTGLKKIDDNTVEITLAAPYAPFLANLATPAGSIFSQAYVEQVGDDFGTKPVGTGPFKVD